jgi:hypothetical protein
MTAELEGKVGLVTSGPSGIGRGMERTRLDSQSGCAGSKIRARQ